MRRNIGNEIIFALAAVIVMVFALAFAVLLSTTSSRGGASSTATFTVASNVEEGTATPSETVEITEKPSLTPTRTVTAARSEATETVEAEDTAVPTLNHTRSTRPPTDEPSTLSSETSVPATSTPQPSDTFTPTRTRTVPLTRTASPTSLPPTPTDPPPVELLPTYTASASATLASTSAASAPTVIARGNCLLPEGWQVYTVLPGNTLFSIARAVGSTVSELSAANCLANPNIITVGDQLFVPTLPNKPVQTGVPFTSTNNVPVMAVAGGVGCGNSSAQIVAPRPGEHVRGTFSLQGTATLGNFWYYRVEVRPDWAAVYNFYSRSEQPVANGQLAAIDSTIFSPGLHWVRVSVIDLTGGIPETAVCAIPLVFD